MEIETAARKRLLAFPSIRNLVGDWVWKFKPQKKLEGTGKGAIVVHRHVSWAEGMGSQEYPILVVDSYCDNSRPLVETLTLKDDREERVMQLDLEVARIFHQVNRETVWWPDEYGLLVLGSFRSQGPTSPVVRDGVAMVRSTYDVQVVH